MFSRFTLPELTSTTAQTSAHRIFVIDCSGSMQDTMQDLCTHLKNKIPQLTTPEDFISVIYFQHQGSVGVIQEHVSVRNLAEIASLNVALDKWLQASGGTYFADAMKLANRLASKYTETAQIFFLTDGCENTKSNVTISAFAETNASAVILVEYGWYTDSDYIKKLAQACNGTQIFSKDFAKVTSSIDTYLTNKITSIRNVLINFHGDCYVEMNGYLKIFTSRNNICTITVPTTIKDVVCFDPSKMTDSQTVQFGTVEEYYLALWYSLVSRRNDLTSLLLTSHGDVHYILRFAVCFSKQDYENLIAEVRESYLDPAKRFKAGVNHDCAPPEYAFTVIDLLKALELDKQAKMYPYHTAFKYERVSKKVEPTAAEANLIIDKLQGCPLHLVYNASRANVSINCTVSAFVNLGPNNQKQSKKLYRNYTIIKDGVKHVDVLPLSMSENTFNLLANAGCIDCVAQPYETNTVYLVDIINLPVINRAMTQGQNFSSQLFARKHVEKIQLKAEKKYINSRVKLAQEEAEVVDVLTAEEEEDTVDRPAKRMKTTYPDSYVATELVVKVAGCSSLPTVNDKLLKKLSSGKLTTTETFMKAIHNRWTASKDPNFATAELERINKAMIDIDSYLEGVKFMILAGRLWFNDAPQQDSENAYEPLKICCNVFSKDFTVTVQRQDKVIEL